MAKGGTNEVTNLLTACTACNSGKSDKTLDENTSVAKARNQLEELQERKEQLEMMMSWREGLQDIKESTVDRVASYWHELAPGITTSKSGLNTIRKWLRTFTLDEVYEAMDIAAEQYLRFEDDESVTEASWEEAFGKDSGHLSRQEGVRD